jgi:YVTN family beta-propeller protein
VPPHSAPNAVAITPDSKSAYVANGEGSVSVIDTAKNTVTTTINFVNSTAKAVAITPNGNYVYVCITNDTDGNVYVISTATNKVTATITTDSVEGIVISPDGERAYLALGGDNTVAVIDTATNTLTKTVSAGLNPSAIAITPDGKYAYVVCDSYTEFTDRPGANYVGTVSVISTGNGAASPQVTPVAEVPAQLLIEVILVGVIVISVGVIVVKLKLWKKQSPNTQCMLIPLFS